METQTTFTLGEAAKVTGKSKGTISKAISSGRLSARDKVGNSYVIDAAELFRVFPRNGPETVENERMATPAETGETAIELATLRGELDRVRAERELLQGERDYLRERLAEADEQHKRLTLLITHQQEARAAPPPAVAAPVAQERPKRRWWPFGAGDR